MNSWIDSLRFDENGLIPAIVQEKETGEVLMLAYMNRESLLRTLETGMTHFWSRKRQRIWRKGETSGNFQKVEDIYYDCDEDALLVKVLQKDNACHTGHRTCFYRKAEKVAEADVGSGALSAAEGTAESAAEDTARGTPRGTLQRIEASHESGAGSSQSGGMAYPGEILVRLYEIVNDRRVNPRPGSYTSSLLLGGQDRVLKKIAEEAGEVMLASKNEDAAEIVREMADLWFHCVIALAYHGISPEEVFRELLRRRK